MNGLERLLEEMGSGRRSDAVAAQQIRESIDLQAAINAHAFYMQHSESHPVMARLEKVIATLTSKLVRRNTL